MLLRSIISLRQISGDPGVLCVYVFADVGVSVGGLAPGSDPQLWVGPVRVYGFDIVCCHGTSHGWSVYDSRFPAKVLESQSWQSVSAATLLECGLGLSLRIAMLWCEEVWGEVLS